MSRRLILVLALALVVGFTAYAFAETQNIKVSGDINIKAVGRDNFDLQKKDFTPAVAREEDNESFFTTQLRLRLDADLTDNVAATVRLINERNWDTETADAAGDSTDIDLDLAYVTMKEFLYSPLTLTVGRQELAFGNQLIIGSANTYGRAILNGVPTDLSLRRAFDAIRATLNYDPLVVDVIYAKINETLNVEAAAPVYRNEDADLYGVNARYDLDSKTTLEGYFFQDKTRDAAGVTQDKNNVVNVVGMLVSSSPIEKLKGSLEMAYQFGDHRSATVTESSSRYDAWALQLMLDYAFSDMKYTPGLALCFTHLSGDKTEGNKDAWDPLYYNQALNSITRAILPFSNMNVINLKGSIKPADDITLLANYGYYLLDEKATTINKIYTNEGGADTWALSGKKPLGNALDLTAIYDYTEDVQLALTAGWFKPGQAFDTAAGSRDATQVIGSMKVTF